MIFNKANALLILPLGINIFNELKRFFIFQNNQFNCFVLFQFKLITLQFLIGCMMLMVVFVSQLIRDV